MATEGLKKWKKGDIGQVVREVIEYNFDYLNRRITERSFTKTFTKSDWKDGVIIIDYYEHRISMPSLHVMMLHNEKYIDVYCGSYVDGDESIYLESDIPFDGKVVIK